MYSEEAITKTELLEKLHNPINIENKTLKNVDNNKIYLKEVNACIKIQAYFRGYNLRKDFTRQNDNYTFRILNKCLDKYIYDLEFTKEINSILSKKKRRNENFPSDISENIAKFAIFKKYKIMPCWDTEKGDIIIDKKDIFKQIEVKGFMSSGPSSFGPREAWDIIYFVDAQDVFHKNFKVYEIKLSNTSDKFRKIKLTGCVMEAENIIELPENIEEMSLSPLRELCKGRGLKRSGNKKELIDRLKTQKPGSGLGIPQTFGDIVSKDQRGKLRGCFYTIFKPQLGEHCKLIFDGDISELYNLF